MEKIQNNKKLFNQSNIFHILILLQVFINMAYVSIEIYKSTVSKPLLDKLELTHNEFAKLVTLSNYASFFENAFLIIVVIYSIMAFTKKYEPFLKDSILIQLTSLSILFIFNYVLAMIFDAPAGNLTQLLFIPLVITFVGIIYFMLKTLFRGNEVKGNI